MSVVLLDHDYVDAALPKQPLGPLRRRMRRYKGILNEQHHIQQTGYTCGPSSAKMVLSIRKVSVSESTLAKKLGTDSDGTDYIGLFPPVLNGYLRGAGYYSINSPRSATLRKVVTDSIDSGFGLVANIVSRSHNRPSFYPTYTVWHYVAIVGYDRPTTTTVRYYIADSANFGGVKHWWVSESQLTSLVSEKGVAPTPRVSTNLLGLSDGELSAIATNFAQLGPS